MLPFKYRKQKITSFRFRNVTNANKKFFFTIEQLYSSKNEIITSSISSKCIVSDFYNYLVQNPNFEL